MESTITYGEFVKELHNRFLCVVKVNEEDTLCYIPSSCKLSNFIDLRGRSVMLIPVKKKKARTCFSLYAVKYKRSFVLLNLSEANKIVATQLRRRMFSFLGSRNSIKREKMIDGYKSDLYIEDTDTLIEVKSLLSFDQEALSPTVYSERANRQLRDIQTILEKGHRVYYIFISFYSGVKQIKINPLQKEYSRLFYECIRQGMSVAAYSVRMDGEQAIIHKRITVV